MTQSRMVEDAVLRVGEVCAVEGRRIYVQVDRKKNLSDLFFDGDILTNIAVNSYVEIRKGFLSIIGRVEGERIQAEELSKDGTPSSAVIDRSSRILNVSLSGYIDERGRFAGGTKELPLIGNEAYILTRKKMRLMHRLVDEEGAPAVGIATLFGDDVPVYLPVDGLFNSHIAIFGNTGSGKTNTLAFLYQEAIRVLQARNPYAFVNNTRFLLFDFNGEYAGDQCLTQQKTVLNLSTRVAGGDRVPMDEDGILDLEVLSILTDATEKTQKPFIRRAVRLFRLASDANDSTTYVRGIIRNRVKDILQMADKQRASLLLDYLSEILPPENAAGQPVDLEGDIEWHNTMQEWKLRNQPIFLKSNPQQIETTTVYQHVDQFSFSTSLVSNLVVFMYLQLMSDVLANRSQNEHIAPVINRLKAKRDDIDRLFDLTGAADFWARNVVVVNLHDVNLDMKKTLPLLLAKKLYTEHKNVGHNKTLTLIIDEAHNILSTESSRESESWKDYRLETFEEIIKEGRKFGVFVTISSQRPNDISPTITSQAHNYFIHRLVNQLDLKTIATAVSYIDRVTEESIPTLPTGTCIFSGVATPVPLKIDVKPLQGDARPRSKTRVFSEVVPPV